MKENIVNTLPTLRLTKSDHRGLRMLVDSLGPQSPKIKATLQPLSMELERAEVVPDESISDQVVRMGSSFQVEDLASGEVDFYTLVYPEYADAEAGLISILVPIGMGVIGFSEGDTFSWRTPGGVRKLKLLKVKPPVTKI